MHRRFLIWSRAGVWGRLHQKVLELLDSQGLVDLSRAVLDSAHVRAEKGGRTCRSIARGPGQAGFHDARPVRRERTAPTRRTLCGEHSRQLGLKPMVAHFHVGHESHSDHSKPQRLHADKAYDVPDLRRWLHSQRIGVRIARKGIDSSERLGRRRWVIEHAISWLTGYRRLSPRYERHPRNYFLGLAAALCCYKRLGKLTM